MLGVYFEELVGAAPAFPNSMEARITASLVPPSQDAVGSHDESLGGTADIGEGIAADQRELPPELSVR